MIVRKYSDIEAQDVNMDGAKGVKKRVLISEVDGAPDLSLFNSEVILLSDSYAEEEQEACPSSPPFSIYWIRITLQAAVWLPDLRTAR